ncbi:hypothetical protein FDP41_012829 [Naegleria fowleri]|uniref:Guanylate cyclase domain-containing protein n=1 Tax=Naegleria fowleri TaxID=5763 RepID=A0A6A5C1Z9_NAEFO|nr:uncharacterized protein FDP41_012829 [Naegleria fowleri]KAF0981041.1 hypothetical protein FDP41_012829 [Naegleria fowleri]
MTSTSYSEDVSASSSMEGMPVVTAVHSQTSQQQQQNLNPTTHGGSIYLSESANQTATTNTSSSDGYSITSQTVDMISKMIVSLEDRHVKKGWRLYLVYGLMYAHLIWTQMMVPTIRDYQWGPYGVYVFQVLNFPTSFLLDWISYRANLVLACIVMLFILFNVALFILAMRFTIKTSKYFKKLKTILRLCSFLLRSFSLTMLFVLLGFFDCDVRNLITVTITSGGSNTAVTQMASLDRFSGTACTETINAIMMAISAIGILALLILYPLSELILSNSNPHSNIPLIRDNSLVVMLVGELAMVQLLASFLIPKQFSYASAAFHVLLSLVSCALVFYFIPFLRRLDNSLYFGACCGKVGASIGSLISSTVNMDSDLPSFNDVGGGFAGMTIGLMMLLFVAGTCFMEIYLRFHAKKMRDYLMNAVVTSQTDLDLFEKHLLFGIEKSASSLFNDLEESKALLSLNIFLKLSLKSGQRNVRGSEYSDSDLSLAFIKGLAHQKSFNDINLLLIFALIIQVKWQGETNCSIFAQSLLRRALKQHPNMFYKLFIQERMKEVETMSQSNNALFEASAQIETLEKNQAALLALHRDFWKECANENINYDTIERIIRSIYALKSECKSTLSNLLFNYPSNKTILRLNANFLENFEFNKELAQQLFTEVNSIEEDETKKRKGSLPSKKGNRVIPTSEYYNKYEISSSAVPLDENFSEIGGETRDEGFELESAFDNPYMKKETIFRQALFNSRDHKLFSIILIVYFTITICIMISTIALSVYYSQAVMSQIPHVEQVCFPGTLPMSIVRNIRATQNWVNVFYLFGYPWPSTNEGFPTISKLSYITDHVSQLNRAIDFFNRLIAAAQANVFSDDIYYDYSHNIYPLYFPNEDPFEKNVYTGTYTSKNASIYEITNAFIAATQKVISNYPLNTLVAIETGINSFTTTQKLLDQVAASSYFHPLTDYNFMFLWINRENVALAYDSFCSSYLNRSFSVFNNSMNEFIIYLSTILSFFFLSSLLFFVYMYHELKYFRKVSKLFGSQIQKDVVGKIFQTLSKKAESGAVHQRKKFSMSKASAKYVTLSLFMFSVIVVAVCVAFMFMESELNTKTSSLTMSKVRLSIQAATSVERASINIGETFTYFGASEMTKSNSVLSHLFNRTVNFGDTKLWNTTNFDFLIARITRRTQELTRQFSSLIYGDASQGLTPIIGQYPAVDTIITVGTKNCTDYMQKNNISLTFTSNLLYCRGMEKVLADFVTLSSQVITDSRKAYLLQQDALANRTLLSPAKLAMQHYTVFRGAVPLLNKFVTFIREFVKSSSQPSSIIVTMAGIFGILLTISSFVGIWYMFSNYWNHIQTLRLMFNYIPIEILDRNEILREYMLNHSVNVITKKKKSNHDDDSLHNLKVTFNSSVEGAIICSENGEMELFNVSGLRMFGMKTIDILGISIYELFDESARADIKKRVDALVGKAKQMGEDSNSGNSEDEATFDSQPVEVIEVDGIRKNRTKFPGKFTFHCVKLEGRIGISIVVTFKDITLEKKQNTLLFEEKQRSENLLKNILPTAVANRLKTGGDSFIAEAINDVTCFFSDMVGFTRISSAMQASELVLMLNTIVIGFDLLTEKYEIEKIKTIGDAYFCVGGLHNSQKGHINSLDHPERVLKFAIETFGVIHHYNSHKKENQEIGIRIGINSGPIVAGVIGKKKFAYDLWGDTVNTASRMESTSLTNRIQISRSTYERVFDLGYDFEEREVDVKGKGQVKAYLLNEQHHKQVEVDQCIIDNDNQIVTNLRESISFLEN